VSKRAPDTARPWLVVLAGVNGAGKSSALSQWVREQSAPLIKTGQFDWFDPDRFARELVTSTGMELAHANGVAWNEGLRRLREAIAQRQSHAFETTLGGNTLREELIRAAASHDIHMLYCGLSDLDTHLRRIAARVERGGHPIPETKVRERLITSPRNLITLMPHLANLHVYDNSREAGPDGIAPDSNLLLMLSEGQLIHPKTPKQLAQTPDWAKPILAAALDMTGAFTPPAGAPPRTARPRRRPKH